jgi:hypothetical protein
LVENGKRVSIDEGELSALPDAAVNVAGAYAALRADIVQGTTKSPGFHHAVQLTRIMEAMLRSSDEARTIVVDQLR